MGFYYNQRVQRPLFILCLFLLASCKRDSAVQSYRVAKESPSDASMSMPLLAPVSEQTELPPGHPPIDSMTMPPSPASNTLRAPGIHWTVPAGWKQQPPSSMRVGSFLIPGKNGKQADMSIIPLAGEAGSDLENVNRWRGQLGLEPTSPAVFAQQSESIKPGGNSMLLVEFANQNKRMLAAICRRDQRAWFFKMMGDDATVAAAKPAFLNFLSSVRFTASPS